MQKGTIFAMHYCGIIVLIYAGMDFMSCRDLSMTNICVVFFFFKKIF